MTNPLLADGLPRFSEIHPEHALPAVEQRLEEYRQVLARIKQLGEAVDYASVALAETLADNALARTWSSISHLHGVCNTDGWRKAYAACLEPLTRFHTERSHDRQLWQAWKRLSERSDLADQSPAMQALIRHELRSFELSGVTLPEAQRKRFGEISLALSELSSRFGNQVVDATEAYSEHFTDPNELAGLPESELNLLAGMATQAGKEGWLANLSYPAWRAIITWAEDRELRQRFHRAFTTRASELGPNAGQFDNGPLVREILALRKKQAELLGLNNHAEAQLKTRMAGSVEQIERFLQDLAERARPQAQAQFDELQAFAAGHGAEIPLQPWDIAWWSEKLRQKQLGISQDLLKPWFELDRVLGGIFNTATALFGVRFERDEHVETWHDDVQYFHMLDGQGQHVAGLYLDLYSRARKSGGAWMDVCRARMKLEGVEQSPIAYLTCNFAAPANDSPSLLTHDDVVTLFHEFGHCLHHLLTRIDLPSVAGISGVEWDAVELPSQLMEGWAWEAESLAHFARHVESDEALPEAYLAGLLADRQFQGALGLLRQIEFALTDLALHSRDQADPLAIMDEINRRIAVVPPPEHNRYLMSFSHLFDGGYSAGYYSYLWAELLARDGFEYLRQQGLFSKAAGKKLVDEILAVGSSRPMQESWLAFRGAEPALEPLLRAWGIAA